MSGARIGLDELEAAYRRVSRARGRGLEDAYDFGIELMIAALERDKVIIEAAFFLLIFGQIEARINELAKRRQRRAEAREVVRELPFERRLHMALPGQHQEAARQEIKRGMRSETRQRTATASLPTTGLPRSCSAPRKSIVSLNRHSSLAHPA